MADRLTVALARTPWTEALFDGSVHDPALALDLPSFPAISRAFAPMVRELRFDASELAIATFLMAKAQAAPLILLPCVLGERFQESALLCPVQSPIAGPDSLRGARIGVRAYSQTTALWLRGVLADRYGIAPSELAWITFEDAHVAGIPDPPWCHRAAAGATLDSQLRSGSIDAAIFGLDLPSDPSLRTVFPDPAEAAASFRAEYGFVPVNHLLVARAELAFSPGLPALLALLSRSGARVLRRSGLSPALLAAARFAFQQGLTPRELTLDELWSGTPATIC